VLMALGFGSWRLYLRSARRKAIVPAQAAPRL
jgi:hypothetical protein